MIKDSENMTHLNIYNLEESEAINSTSTASYEKTCTKARNATTEVRVHRDECWTPDYLEMLCLDQLNVQEIEEAITENNKHSNNVLAMELTASTAADTTINLPTSAEFFEETEGTAIISVHTVGSNAEVTDATKANPCSSYQVQSFMGPPPETPIAENSLNFPTVDFINVNELMNVEVVPIRSIYDHILPVLLTSIDLENIKSDGTTGVTPATTTPPGPSIKGDIDWSPTDRFENNGCEDMDIEDLVATQVFPTTTAPSPNLNSTSLPAVSANAASFFKDVDCSLSPGKQINQLEKQNFDSAEIMCTAMQIHGEIKCTDKNKSWSDYHIAEQQSAYTIDDVAHDEARRIESFQIIQKHEKNIHSSGKSNNTKTKNVSEKNASGKEIVVSKRSNSEESNSKRSTSKRSASKRSASKMSRSSTSEEHDDKHKLTIDSPEIEYQKQPAEAEASSVSNTKTKRSSKLTKNSDNRKKSTEKTNLKPNSSERSTKTSTTDSAKTIKKAKGLEQNAEQKGNKVEELCSLQLCSEANVVLPSDKVANNQRQFTEVIPMDIGMEREEPEDLRRRLELFRCPMFNLLDSSASSFSSTDAIEGSIVLLDPDESWTNDTDYSVYRT